VDEAILDVVELVKVLHNCLTLIIYKVLDKIISADGNPKANVTVNHKRRGREQGTKVREGSFVPNSYNIITSGYSFNDLQLTSSDFGVSTGLISQGYWENTKWYFVNVERGNIADKLRPRNIKRNLY
jgi:hypothetical protein